MILLGKLQNQQFSVMSKKHGRLYEKIVSMDNLKNNFIDTGK